MSDDALQARRAEDQEGIRAVICWMAQRASEFWDFIDKRDIDKHAVSIFIMMGTWKLTEWAALFAQAHIDRPGLEVAAVIAAVTAPYMALQAAAIAFYFKARA